VLKVYHASSKESARTAGVMSPESQVEEALGSCLLPSLQLIPANPAVDMEIWGVLSLLPYEVCHASWSLLDVLHYLFNQYGTVPIVLAARQTAKVACLFHAWVFLLSHTILS
jgi:THO complex subunit 2